MCAAVGRVIRALDIVVGIFNLRKEVLRWMDFPIVNQNDPKHFLPPWEAREKIDNHQPYLKNIVDVIPDARKNAEEKYALLREKEIDKEFSFFDSKVRSTVCCYSCRAHC